MRKSYEKAGKYAWRFSHHLVSTAFYGRLAAILKHNLGKEAASVPDLVLVEEAAQQSSYDKNHIRYLARKGLIQGKKIGAIWLINLESLKDYEARMNAEGTQKHTPIRYKDSD